VHIDKGHEVLLYHAVVTPGSSKAEYSEHVDSHFEYRRSHCSYSSRTKGRRLRRHVNDFHGTQLDDLSQTSSTSVTYNHHHHQQQQQRLMKCKQCPFSTRVRVSGVSSFYWNIKNLILNTEKCTVMYRSGLDACWDSLLHLEMLMREDCWESDQEEDHAARRWMMLLWKDESNGWWELCIVTRNLSLP